MPLNKNQTNIENIVLFCNQIFMNEPNFGIK